MVFRRGQKTTASEANRISQEQHNHQGPGAVSVFAGWSADAGTVTRDRDGGGLRGPVVVPMGQAGQPWGRWLKAGHRVASGTRASSKTDGRATGGWTGLSLPGPLGRRDDFRTTAEQGWNRVTGPQLGMRLGSLLPRARAGISASPGGPD